MHCKRFNDTFLYLTIFLLLLFSGCAHVKPSSPEKPFSKAETARIVSHLRKSEGGTESFYSVGKLKLKHKGKEIELNLVVAGSSKPLKMRFEITHQWGKPLFHIVADESNISVLSLADNKFFEGPITAFKRPEFFLFGLGVELMWKVLAGIVPIMPYDRAVSRKPNEIALYSRQEGLIEVISFSSSSFQPSSVFFPQKNLLIRVGDVEKRENSLHAMRTEIEKIDEKQKLLIRYASLEVNKTIPNEIFELHAPPDFEIIDLRFDEGGTASSSGHYIPQGETYGTEG